ncbi:MAG: hypothetical protein ACI9PP_002107 [Halobacteriales archaeon]
MSRTSATKPLPERSPGLRYRIPFWAFLGLVSTAFAEVLFPNTPFSPVAMAGIAFPVYFLHSVFLAGVVFRSGRVSFSSLYLAGVLFGLYEAYVTKVVWDPVGDPIPIQVAGLYPFEGLSLVLFWHPIMAFVIPVTVVELVATKSNRSVGPPLAGHAYASHLAVVAGASLSVFHGVLGEGPVTTLISTVSTLVVLFAVLWGWRRAGGHRFAMGQLLPRGRELRVLGVLLLGLYVIYGVALRPEALPERPLPHLLVLSTYAVVGGALLLSLRRPEAGDPSTDVSFSWRRVLAVAGAFVTATGAAGLFLTPLGTGVFLSYFVVGPTVGLACIVFVVRRLRR